MKNLASILFLLFLVSSINLITAFGNKGMKTNESKSIISEKEIILKVIEDESSAFWNNESAKLSSYWLHAPYVRTIGKWKNDSVSMNNGWTDRVKLVRKRNLENPAPNQQNIFRDKINIRVLKNAAWVTFDQYRVDSGEPNIDLPNLSHETRFLEKHNGKWKIVYAGWLLNE